ncbi:NADH-quinone oxidoreductase subunit NuoH [Aestuariivivens insulae]|uniref:NADH-quinone oxidoreductase subunit NuoH n=1 Tax=Aestuariivivens insulae TaxID=1621988 RepID=UPI001F5A8E9C|nr:NADH-quinone oxidoreductase subunit NuoH [Aestuariivivens insulae]
MFRLIIQYCFSITDIHASVIGLRSSGITRSIQDWLSGMMPEATAQIVGMVIIALIYLGIFSVAGLFLVLIERRVAAWFQLRIGPNRVGFQGLLQTMADALKLVSKELTGTERADKFLYNLAPYFVIISALMALGLIPFTKAFQAFDINIGIFFLIAISSIGVIGILLGGWASNNKFALIGAMRSGVQTISYELSVGLSLLTMILLTGSLQLSEIVEVQKNGWLIVQGHIPAIIAFMIFMIAGTAETNRAPFDMVEAESELGAGFHTEYSGMKFAYFFLAEFINMFIIAAIATTVFFGAWLSPFGITESIPILGVFWFLAKAMVLVFLMMWFRWTFPRLRVDQLLTLEWKYLLPINLANIVIMAFIVWQKLIIQI